MTASWTAAEVARCLSGRRGRILLDSASDADGLGRWSFAGAAPAAELEVRGERWIVRDERGEITRSGTASAAEVIELLESMAAEYGAAESVSVGAPPLPVAIGWLSYSLGHALCGLPSARAPRGAPAEADLWFGFYRALYRHDRHSGAGQLVGDDRGAVASLAGWIEEGGAADRGGGSAAHGWALGPLVAEDVGDAAYRHGFARVQGYLRAGDAYQVNLARRLVARVERVGDPLALAIRAAEVPYRALVEPGDGISVLSASPERFLHRAAGSRRVETRPIKGTRRRTGDPAIDAAVRAELLADPKERAEHLMIVDLERNDLGRVAEVGSVRVDSFSRVIDLPTVFHVASTVSCEVREGVGVAALLGATFPGGSITGAPRRRAMEIIAELEPRPRGVYTGAIGYLGQGGAIDLAVAIRTAVLEPDRITLAVGGGVVADSTVERELAETAEKAASWAAALAWAA